jgi:hypothetical protein
MKPLRFCLILILLTSAVSLVLAQLPQKPVNLDYKEGKPGEIPVGWFFPTVCKDGGYEAVLVETNDHRSLQIFSRARPKADTFGNVLQSIDATPFRGKRVRFRAKLRAEVDQGASGQAMLWLRVDRPDNKMGFFDNMADRPVKDTEDHICDIVGDVAEDAESIVFGFMLIGTGEAWMDKVSFEIVGKDVPTTGPKMPGPGINTTRGGYIFKAIADVEEPKIAFPIPLLFEHQVPLTFELKTIPPNVIKMAAYKERKPDDWIVEVTFNPVKRGQTVELSWQSDVLIALTDLSGLPATSPLPNLANLPANIKEWLSSTKCVQVENADIVAEAKKAKIRPDLMSIVQNVAQVPPSIKLAAPLTLDAVEALHKGGSCTSCANLAAALLRANGIPARILACYPTWAGPLQTHYIVEYFVPQKGWVWMESTMGKTPLEPYQYVIVGVVYTEDEQRSFEPHRWSAPGVPYLSLTENLGDPNFAVWRMLIAPDKACDHVATLTTALTETDTAKWKETFLLASNLWKTHLNNLQKGNAPTASLKSAQRLAASATTLDALIKNLKSVQKEVQSLPASP